MEILCKTKDIGHHQNGNLMIPAHMIQYTMEVLGILTFLMVMNPEWLGKESTYYARTVCILDN